MTERDWRIFREDFDIIIKGGRVPNPIRSWEESTLPEFILNSIKSAGYKKPSAIQIQGISIGLERRDMIGLAPTGSGKSAAFLIPLIVYLNNLPAITTETAQNGPYAMILAPTRELASQIFEEFNKFAKYTKLRAALIVGGKSAEEQALILGVGVECIIGTPGRIQDCLEKHFTILNQCNYVILDEGDKMIKDGFEENLNFILDYIPSTNLKSEDEKLNEEQEKECKLGIKTYRITMMFSATMTNQLEKLARKYLRCPSYISIGEPGSGKKEIDQKVEIISENQKKDRLLDLLNKFKAPIMIFLNHKSSVDNLCKFLERVDIKCCSLHGGKTQDAREKALRKFKEGKFDVLVCTSVLARGIDVTGVTLVVNYDAPKSMEGK
jgi:ATP-dependent RNA helicase DDX23/PRP28